jgi:hypothetical protein
MTLEKLPASQTGVMYPCKKCKRMTQAAKLLRDTDGIAFNNYYCSACSPQFLCV